MSAKPNVKVVTVLVHRSSDMGEAWREIVPTCKVRAVVVVARRASELHLAVEATAERLIAGDPRVCVQSAVLVRTVSSGSEVANGLAGSEFAPMLRREERAELESEILLMVRTTCWETGAVKVVGDTAYELTPAFVDGAKAWFSGTPYGAGRGRDDDDERSEWEDGHVLASSGDISEAEVDAAAELLKTKVGSR